MIDGIQLAKREVKGSEEVLLLLFKQSAAMEVVDVEEESYARRMQPTMEEAKQCQFHCWYPKFGPKYVGKVETIELREDFVNYLKQDGISVPETSRVFGRPTSASSTSSSSSGVDRGDGNPSESVREEDEEDEENGTGDTLENFGELVSKIDDSIAALEGYVMPRLNWSCPKDAIWINPLGSMRCDNADELILMLKASDRVLNDVLHAFETCVDYDPSIAATHKYVLSLRKWYDFNRSRELRCFVVNSKLTGVSQRYLNEDTSDLNEEKTDILDKVKDFFDQVMKEKVALKSYAFDIHISKKSGRITIIDVNQCSSDTNPLLFSWEELFDAEKDQGKDVELRLADSKDAEQTVSEKTVYGFPIDFVENNMDMNDFKDNIENLNDLDLFDDQQ